MSETDEGRTATPRSPAVAGAQRARQWASVASGLRSATRGGASSIQASLLVVVATGIVLAGQLAEDQAESGRLTMLSPTDSIQRWTIVIAALYMVLIVLAIDAEIRRS